MPHAIIIPSITQGLAWQDLRKGLRACILSVAPNARVYSSWPLKYDIGQTVSLLRSENDSNKIHAWIIGINRAEPFDEKAGGYNLQWELNVRIWGFVGYDAIHDDSVQHTLEAECRLITQVIYINQKHLGLESTDALKRGNYMVTWEDIDVNAFGDGNDVYVAQGNLVVTLSETFAL
jgi:hypothetical protein